MSISTVSQTVTGSLAGALEQVKHFVGYLAGRIVTFVRNYPGLMQDNRAAAIATFIGVNIIVLKISNWAATNAEERVDNELNEKLNSNGKAVKIAVVSLIVGSAAYAASAVLSEVAAYPLTRGALLTISVFAVFARYVGKAWVEIAETRAAKNKQLEEANNKIAAERGIASEELAEQEAINGLENADPKKAERQAALNKKKTDREEARQKAEEEASLKEKNARLALEKAATEAATEKKQKADEAKFTKVLQEVAEKTKPLSKEEKDSLEGYLLLDMNLQEYRKASKTTYQYEVKQAQEKIKGIHLELKEAIAHNKEASITQSTQNLIEIENEYNRVVRELIESMAKK